MVPSVGFPPVEGPRVGQPWFNCVTTKSHGAECRVPTRERATGGAASVQLCDNKIPMMPSVGFPPVEGPRVGQPRFNYGTTKSHDAECRVSHPWKGHGW